MIWFAWLTLPALAGPVSLTTSDAISLTADSYGSGTRGVLLVHDEARSRADYGMLGPRLAAAGYLVLALDLRGHGGSSIPSPLVEEDWPKLVGDVTAGLGWLAARGVTEVHLLGAGLGANLALNAAVGAPVVTDLVLLSPALNAHGVRVSTAMSALGPRSILVVSSSDDALALKAATWVASQATGTKELATYSGAGTGARMLATAPDLEGRILGWLAASGNAGDPGNDPAHPSKSGQLKAGDVGAIPTSGVRIEERKR